jgi:hypothetical protein
MSSTIATLLLRLYPSHFQEAYGPEALQLIQDRWRDERGVLERARLCADLSADLVITRFRARNDADAISPASTSAGILFRAFERETTGPATVLPGMVLSLLMVAIFVTLITPEGDRDIGILLADLSALPPKLFEIWRR